jgi:hypothetical protein
MYSLAVYVPGFHGLSLCVVFRPEPLVMARVGLVQVKIAVECAVGFVLTALAPSLLAGIDWRGFVRPAYIVVVCFKSRPMQVDESLL